MTATLSPLLAGGATLKNTAISAIHRLIMIQKCANTEGCCVIDDTQNPSDLFKTKAEINNHLADRLCQDFLHEKHEKHLSQKQSRKSETSAGVYIVDQKHIDSRPSHCCELI